jgi:integrase
MKLDVKDLAPATPRYEEPLPEVYTDADLTALLTRVKDERLALAFELLLKSGMREGEAVHLPWKMVNFEHRFIRVRSNPEWGFKVKDKEQRDIPLSPDMMEKLRAWKEKRGGKLVLGTEKDRPETKLLRHLKNTALDLGLNCGECATVSTTTDPNTKETISRELHCYKYACCEHRFLHKFRATYTTKMLRSGMDLRSTMRLTGHSDLESVMRYLSPATDAEIQEHVRTMIWISEPKTFTRRADAPQPKRRSSPGRSGRSSRIVSKATVRS